MKFRFIKYLRLLLNNIFIRLFFRSREEQKKYYVSVCAIFKNEAPFIKEWIEFHSLIGIEHFYMYNNNSEDNYKNILEPYIEKGIVTLIEWPYEQGQIKAYKNFYDQFRQETQWVSFLDLDEFICPKFEFYIMDWIKSYERYPVILIYWKMFGTSGKMNHDFSKLVTEQYTVSWDYLYNTGKCIINTDYEIAEFNASVHHCTKVYYPISFFYLKLHPINVSKVFINQFKYILGLNVIGLDSIQINHYWSKAWDIYNKKRFGTDVYFKKNPKQDISYFIAHEKNNRTCDYTIFRYLIQLKHNMSNLI